MKMKLSSCLFLALSCFVIAGCSDGPVTATDGATADDIAAYEAAVAAAEQQDVDMDMETEAEGDAE